MTKTLLQINVTCNWGSTGRIAEEIGQVAIKNGWRSYIAFSRGNPNSQSQLIRIGSKWDMYEHGIESRLLDNHGMASRGATRKLIEQIETIKPDIIHLHNIHGYFINYQILFDYLAKSGIPVVWTLHDCWSFTGHCSYFMVSNCYQWREGECGNCNHKMAYPVSPLLNRSHRNFIAKKKAFTSVGNVTVVAVSRWLEQLAEQSFLGTHHVVCIYNGVNVNVFKPKDNKAEVKRKLGIKQRYMLVGVASIWTSTKGLADFVKLRAVLPDDEYAIVLVGVDDKQAKLLPEGIMVMRRTNNVAELADIYSAADVFVNPTWQDNFPTTNLEALACGTPVVTYRTGGSPEAVDEKSGFVVEQGDISGLAKAVNTICSRGKNHYSAACRQRALDHYDKDDCFKDYVKLYELLLLKN